VAVSKKKRRATHRAYDRYEKNLLKKYIPIVKKFLDKQTVSIAKAIKKIPEKKQDDKLTEEEIRANAEVEATKLFDKNYDIERDIPELQITLFPLLFSAGNIGNDLANIMLYATEGDYQLFNIIEPKYLEFIETHGLEMSKSINTTSRKRAIRIMRDGIIKGERYSTIADTLLKEMKEQNIARARTIVATEVHASFMTARDINAESGGFKEKHWLSSKDKVVRPWHAKYDNEGWVKFSHKWGGVMKFPGDPAGSAKENANCRCDISYR
jgi:hypothetical protein